MKQRTVLYADDGMILTDGTSYGRVIFLADDKTEADFSEITESEYQKVMEEKNKEEEIIE